MYLNLDLEKSLQPPVWLEKSLTQGNTWKKDIKKDVVHF